MQRVVRAVGLTLVSATMAGGLAACHFPGTYAPKTVLSYGTDIPVALRPSPGSMLDTAPRAAWGAPGRLVVVIWGSGSCPSLPAHVSAKGAHRIVISTVDYQGGGDACTADLRPTASIVAVPEGIDERHDVDVVIDKTTLRLGPRTE